MVAARLSGVVSWLDGAMPCGSSGAVDVASLESTSSENHGHRPCPMVSASAAVDLGGATKLPRTVHDGAVEQTTFVQILNQTRTTRLSRLGSRFVRSSVKFWLCVSQPTALMVTNLTPASIKRRAARHPCPNCVRPYRSRRRVKSDSALTKAGAAFVAECGCHGTRNRLLATLRQ